MMTDKTTIVIFGASGDLAHRKLIPALYSLYVKERLPQQLQIIGVSRSEYSHDDYRDEVRETTEKHASAPFDDATWSQFAPKIFYHAADAAEIDGMESLKNYLEQQEDGDGNRLYYLSVAPQLYEPIIANLGQLHMAQETDEHQPWRRIVIEKPFGYDSESAHKLNDAVHHVFHESQVYRIDHYLGKETAQNILFFRFANTIFEPIWNRQYIDNIQITVSEQVDVGRRAGYYDRSGVVRDMFQNHLMQLLTLIAMEPPAAFDASSLRNEKVKVLRSIRPLALEDTVHAQYAGYLDAEGVQENSSTPTFAALKVNIDNWRWQGVPFYLRSGKKLKDKVSEINIIFKRPPHMMFPTDGGFAANSISIHIQPDEGIHLRFEAKVPDSINSTRSVEMEFHYADSFGEAAIPEAYERLLLDALNGDAALFTRSDEIEEAWRIVDPIINGWQTDDTAPPLVTYEGGTWGPKEADELLARYGHQWRISSLHGNH